MESEYENYAVGQTVDNDKYKELEKRYNEWENKHKTTFKISFTNN